MFKEKRPEPAHDPTALVNLAVLYGFITRDQANRALDHRHNRSDKRIGQVLLDLSLITDKQLDLLVLAQQQLRARTTKKPVYQILDSAVDQTRSLSDRLGSLPRSLIRRLTANGGTK